MGTKNQRYEPRVYASFAIPWRLPGYNDVIAANRKNPHAGAALKKNTDAAIVDLLRIASIPPVAEPVAVQMVFTEPNRRRDVDNVESAKKYILDALVKSGVLPNDSPRWVRAVPSYTVYGGDARVDVTLYDAEDWAQMCRTRREAGAWE